MAKHVIAQRAIIAGVLRLAFVTALVLLGPAAWGQNPALRIFINESRLSPFHLGLAYEESNSFNISTTGTDRTYEWARMRGGLEWHPWKPFIARIGYNQGRGSATSMTERFAVGTTVRLWSHEVYYAWAPLGHKDHSHYLSFAYRF